MADLIELDLVVRDKGLKASVSTVERLERQIIKAQKAVDQNTISQARYNKILLAAKRDYQALGMSSQKATAAVRAFAAANKQAQVAVVAQTSALNSATVATNKLSAAQSQTKNKMNGNNMAIQQLGYQFGDFAVQVQGGTSAFVAFSQQGAQLAGILPMIATPLGLSMGMAVGLSAALGILIPIGSAVARMFFEMKDEAKESASEVEALDGRVKAITDTLDKLSRVQIAMDLGITTQQLDLLDQQGIKIEEFAKTAEDAGTSLSRMAASWASSDVPFLNALSFLMFGATDADDVQTAADKVIAAQDLVDRNAKRIAKEQSQLFQKRDLEGYRANLLLATELENGADSDVYYNTKNRISLQIFQEEIEAQVKLNELTEDQGRLLVEQEVQRMAIIENDRERNNLAKARLELQGYQAQRELELSAANSKYEREQDAIRSKELDKTNKKITEMAERLAIPFAAALGLIRQAKAEASVGLDEFGGSGSFKYSGTSKFDGEAVYDARIAASKKAADALAKETKSLKDQAKQMNLNSNATAKYADSYAKLVELKKYGLGDEAFANEVAALNEELANSSPLLTGFTDAFTDFLSRGATDFKSFTKDIMGMFKNMIVQMIAMAARNKIMLSLGMGGSVAATGLSAATGGGGGGFGTGIASSIGMIITAGKAMITTAAAFTGGLSAGVASISASIATATAANTAAAAAVASGTSTIAATTAATTAAGTATAAAIGSVLLPVLAIAAVFSFLKKKVTELDSGLVGVIGTLESTISSFSDIKTKRFWRNKYSTTTTQLTEEQSAPLDAAIMSIQGPIKQAAEVLGFVGDIFDTFSYDLKLSLKGLTEDEQLAAITEEFNKMGDAFASVIPFIGSMEELAYVLDERLNLQNELLQLEGNTIELRRRELEAVHILNKSLAARVQLMQAEADMGTALSVFAAGISEQQGVIRQAVDALVSPLQEALNRTRDAAKDSYKIFREASSKARTEAKTFVDILRGALDSRKIKSEAVELKSYRTSQQQLAAFAGGAEYDKESLGRAAQGVSIDSQKFFGSFEDYARDFYRTQITLEELEKKAAKELTDVEVQIAIAEKAYEVAMGTYKESVDMNTSMDTLLSDLAAYAEVAARNEPFIAQIKAEGDRQIQALDDILVETTKVVNAELGIADTIADLVGSNVSVGEALVILGIKEGEMAGAVLALSTPVGDIGSHIADFDTSLAGAYDRLGININSLLDLDLTGDLTANAATLAAKAGELKLGLVTTDGLINTFTDETKKTAANLLTLNGTVITQTTQIGALGTATDDLGIDVFNLGTTLTTAMGSLGSLVGGLSGAVTGLASAQNALAAAQEVANSAKAADDARAAAAAAEAERLAEIKKIQDLIPDINLGSPAEAAVTKTFNQNNNNTDNNPWEAFENHDAIMAVSDAYKASQNGGDGSASSGTQTSGGGSANSGSSFSEAVSSGWSKIKNAFGFEKKARGGMFAGGLRLVGEEGPELEATGPSRIYSKKDTASMLSGGSESVVAELRSLRHEVSELKAEQRKVGVENVKYNKKSYDLYREWDTVGLPATRTA